MDWTFGLVIVAVAAVIAYPYFRDLILQKRLTPRERQAAPGDFVALSDGVVHYLQRGPADGPVVVMIHGFSAPMFVFEQNTDALAKAGFRVVLFDHFGRGWSDRPRARYDPDFYDRELVDLFDALDLKQPVGLVGYSMGGVIAAEFTARHPERVSKLFLLAPAGLALHLLVRGLFARLTKLPVIGDWLWRLGGRAVLTEDQQWVDGALPPERRVQGDIREQMTYRGYLPAILSTWHHLPMRDRDDIFGQAAATGVPMMALFGGKDPTIDSKSIERLRRVAPDARIEVIQEADHGLAYELFDTVNPMLIAFFSNGQR